MRHPLPNGIISQRFGANPAQYAEYGLAGHEGLDLMASSGTPVLAAHDGAALVYHGSPTYGEYVALAAVGVQTLYAHLSRVCVRAGQAVREGDLIGLVGSTGCSTGPHLHFGVKPIPIDYGNGYKGFVDPEPWIMGEDMTDEDRERIVAARWNAEQAVREIEQVMVSLQAARERLVNETIPKLYAAETQNT